MSAHLRSGIIGAGFIGGVHAHAVGREAGAGNSGGEAGDLWLLNRLCLQDWLADATETNWRAHPAKGRGARAIGDMGVHWCDLMEFTTGHRVVRISARTHNGPARRARARTAMRTVRSSCSRPIVERWDRSSTSSRWRSPAGSR